MRYWLPQIILLTGVLAFLHRLPQLGSMGAALLAAILAAATVWVLCIAADALVATGESETLSPLAPDTDA